MQKQNSTLSILDLEDIISMKYLKSYITSSGNASMAVSTIFETEKKYTIWYNGLSRSPRNKFAKQYARQ